MQKKRDDTSMPAAKKGETTPGILTSRLPIRIDDLLHARVIEIERIEFKAGIPIPSVEGIYSEGRLGDYKE